MTHRTIRQRILASFAIISALMIVMLVVAYVSLARIERETVSVQADSLPGLYYSTQIRGAGWLNYLLTQKYVLQADPAAKEQVAAELKANRETLDDLLTKYEATINSAEDRAEFEAYKNTRIPYTRVQEEVIRTSAEPSGEHEAAVMLNTQLHTELMDVQGAISTVADWNTAAANEATRKVGVAVAAARTGVVVTFLVALVVAVISAYFLFQAITRPLRRLVSVMDVMRTGDFTQRLDLQRRDEFGALAEGFNRMTDELTALVGQVQKSGIKVNTSAMEIAATAKQQQATASEIAATTSEISATSKEISATSTDLVKTMTEVAAVAEQSAALAGSGQVGLAHMEETMRHVMEAAGTINAKLAVLSEKAGNISQVVVTITKVADQTNLLSLNAAIEAEKAGEYGRGFAVVATEIRRLADQTAVATYDIEQTVTEIQSAVSAGVMGMDKFSEEVRRGMEEVQQVGGQLSQIIQQVQALAPRFEVVSEGMQAQTIGAAEITQALTQLSEAAQQTVDSLRQSSQAIEELNQVAGGLGSGVSRFRLAA